MNKTNTMQQFSLFTTQYWIFIKQLSGQFQKLKRGNEGSPNSRIRFTNCIREIPDGLVLNQAAKESGWGSSRFAIEGFNFFGQWCFKAGCGFVPSKRSPGKYHEVAKFPDIAASVNAYFYNLNTFYVYDDLRSIRAEVRQLENQVSAQKLAHGLKRYSERGDQYVLEIQTMIVSNSKFMDES